MAIIRSLGIKKVSVRGLFGLYDYDIPKDSKNAQINKIMILYGQNGAGKTTLLNMIFHLLATAPRQGHKNHLARTKFNSLKIELTNGDHIWASRNKEEFSGSYTTECEIKGEYKKAEWIVDTDGIIKDSSPDELAIHREFLEIVSSLKLQLYLLSDNRRVQLDGGDDYYPRRIYRQDEIQGWRSAEQEEDPEAILFRLLNRSIRKAEDWLRRQVIRGTSQGESDVNAIYAEIIKNLTSVRSSETKKKIAKEDVLRRLGDIEKRNNSYKKYGLTTNFNTSSLEDQVHGVSSAKFTNVKRILMPYLDSFEAKLNAMQDVQQRISSLVETINSFLVDKHLTFNIRGGFNIISKSKEVLKPEMLSSGERHLLLLFGSK